jgi:hypothetical protein
VAALLFGLFSIAAVSAQDEPAGSFIITEVRYEIDGRTRQWALEDATEIREGQTFETRADLEAFLGDQRQLLLNQRQLQEVEISVVERPPVEGEPTRVVVEIVVEDTLNSIALPYFRYDSNTGLLLSIRARDYNFFGTLQELAINFDYERTEDAEDVYTVDAEFTVPFNMFDRRWRLSFQQKFEYEANTIELEEEGIDFLTAIGLGYDFNWLRQVWTASYTQEYRLLTADPDDDYYFTSRVALETEIDTGLSWQPFGKITYNPEVYTQISYSPEGISDSREGLENGFTHSLRSGRFDWIGNYRDGETIRLSNTNEYNVAKEDADFSIEFETAWYKKLWHPSTDVWPKAGVSARFLSFYLIDGADPDQDDAAKPIRGVLNDRMNGDVGVFLNLDATITVWTLRPIIEAQVGTFFDVAFVRDTEGRFTDDRSFDARRDLRFGSGIEVIGFPLFARSLYIRGTYGIDLRGVADGASPLSSDVREIFIGLGHHY